MSNKITVKNVMDHFSTDDFEVTQPLAYGFLVIMERMGAVKRDGEFREEGQRGRGQHLFKLVSTDKLVEKIEKLFSKDHTVLAKRAKRKAAKAKTVQAEAPKTETPPAPQAEPATAPEQTAAPAEAPAPTVETVVAETVTEVVAEVAQNLQSETDDGEVIEVDEEEVVTEVVETTETETPAQV